MTRSGHFRIRKSLLAIAGGLAVAAGITSVSLADVQRRANIVPARSFDTAYLSPDGKYRIASALEYRQLINDTGSYSVIKVVTTDSKRESVFRIGDGDEKAYFLWLPGRRHCLVYSLPEYPARLAIWTGGKSQHHQVLINKTTGTLFLRGVSRNGRKAFYSYFPDVPKNGRPIGATENFAEQKRVIVIPPP